MNKSNGWCGKLALLALVFGLVGGYSCYADTDVTQLVQDAKTLWDSVKEIVIGIVGFSLLIFVAMKVRRR